MSQYTSIIEPSDFVGDVKLAKNSFTETDIESYIAETQEKILKDLLGDDLYKKFGATLPTPTSGTKYAHLLNGTTYVDPQLSPIDYLLLSFESIGDDIDINVDYTGLEKMLKLFTFVKISEELPNYNTIIGTVKGSSQNGESLSNLNLTAFIERRYNEAIDLYNMARKFIIDHRLISTTSTAVSGSGTYVFLVPSTKYLTVGDTVTIGASDYTVSAVSSNTSISITGSTGLSFSATSLIEWDAFPTFQGRKKDKSFLGGSI